MPDLKTTLADPEFQGLPEPEQIKVLGAIDADFAGLPAEEQAKAYKSMIEPSFFEKAGDVLGGVAETPVALATGMMGFVGGTAKTMGDVAGQAMYSDEPVDVGAARQVGQEFAQKYTYQPRTKTGETLTSVVTFPFMAAIEYGGPGAQETYNQIKTLLSSAPEFAGNWQAGMSQVGEAIMADARGDFTKHADIISELNLSESQEHEMGKLMAELGLIAAPFMKKGGKAINRAIEADITTMAEKATPKAPGMQGTLEAVFQEPIKAIKEVPAVQSTPEAKYAASINLERIGVDKDARDIIIETAEQNKGMIDEARRDVITFEETQQLATDLGMTIETLLSRRKGETFNAEQALAARQVLASSSERLAVLQKAVRENNSDQNLTGLREAIEQHARIQAEVSGIATEAGRSLSQFRMNAGPEKGYKAALEAMGGREFTQEIADRFAKIDFSNPAEVNRFTRDVSKATTMDMVFEAWINALLSNPTTHAVNTLSNTMTFMLKFPEKATAVGIEAIRAKVKGGPREIFAGEIPHEVFGAWEGVKQGVRKGLWSFINEMATEGTSKIELRRHEAIPSKEINILGKKVKVGGKQVRLPGRMLMAMDEFFKAINYESSKHGLAYREASKQGLKGESKTLKIKELIDNPTKEMTKKAREDMLYRVFQKELGVIGKGFQRVRESNPTFTLIMPFLRTPINIAKYGLERTPLNYARIAGKARKGELKKGQLSEELARATVGSMIQVATFMMAKEGAITGGGPDDDAERELKYRLGWQPYSIKAGDTYYAYGRLEPVGMVMGMAADAAEIWDDLEEDEREDLAATIVHAFGKNITSKTFLKGISDVMNAHYDPNRYLQSFTARMAGTAIPSFVAGVERAVDPEMRDAQTVMDTLKGRMPGLSKDLPERLDLWGETIKYGGNVVSRIASPIYTSKMKGNKIDKEMQRIGFAIGSPSRMVNHEKLSPPQYHQYVKMAGQISKERLLKEINSPWWDKKTDMAKEKTIRTHIRVARMEAKNKLFGSTGEK